MTDNNNKENEVYNYFLELSKPTEEDFQRVFTDKELKELCLKQQCRVDIWRWNVVNDYSILFTRSGRYQRWSDRKRLLMLAKAVNKMKPAVLYDEEEIKRTRKEEWGLQLKENILSLNYWKHKRLHSLQDSREAGLLLHVSDTEEIDEEIQSQFSVNTESMNAAEICTESQTQTGITEVCPVATPTTVAAKALEPSSQSDEGNVLLDNWDEEYLIDEDSDNSTETVLLNEQPQEKSLESNAEKPVESLQSEEVAPEIEDIYGVNTMSITIDSQFSTQTENMNLLQSQDIISQNYDNFKNIIPLTSTQSQVQESEEIGVS